MIITGAEQPAAIVNSNMPSASVIRKGLVCSCIIHKQVCGIAFKIPVMLSFGMCLCIGSLGIIVCVVNDNVFWSLTSVAVIVTD